MKHQSVTVSTRAIMKIIIILFYIPACKFTLKYSRPPNIYRPPLTASSSPPISLLIFKSQICFFLVVITYTYMTPSIYTAVSNTAVLHQSRSIAAVLGGGPGVEVVLINHFFTVGCDVPSITDGVLVESQEISSDNAAPYSPGATVSFTCTDDLILMVRIIPVGPTRHIFW